jgi:predicted TIM-barrel fold metal-dependent hydrolase
VKLTGNLGVKPTIPRSDENDGVRALEVIDIYDIYLKNHPSNPARSQRNWIVVIDCETHVFKFINMVEGRHEGCRVENLIAEMDRAGVDKTFLIHYNLTMLSHPGAQFPQFPGQVDNVFSENDGEQAAYFQAAFRRHRDRFFAFDITDPRNPNELARLDRLHREGLLQGIGEMQPGYQYVMPDDERFMALYRFAADRGLPVILTAEGWDQYPGYFPSKNWDDYFSKFERIVRGFPSVRFMLAHGGNCGSIVYSESYDEYLRANERCHRFVAQVDNLALCMCVPWWIGSRHWPLAPGYSWDGDVHPFFPKLMKHLREHVGFEKLCWASDWPYCSWALSFNTTYPTVVDFFRHTAGLSERERACLMGGTASRFITG